MKKEYQPGIKYKLFKTYTRFWHDRVLYRKTYWLNTEIIPPDGVPLLVVSNHQNALNDPMGILFSFRDRKANFITRADVFTWHPLFSKFMRGIGLLPAFRLAHEGEESLGKNQEMFRLSERALVDGCTVVMYPEAGHQDKRWLGPFSFGYTKLAFEAAELENFEKEIFILPSCNHYSDYFHIQGQLLIKYGTPISLKPFYDLYREKPRTAQRQVNDLVRAQIEGLMLNITDLENYDTIDFLRNTCGKRYAVKHGADVNCLPEMLLFDKTFCARVEDFAAQEKAAADTLYARAQTLKNELTVRKLADADFDKNPRLVPSVCRLVGLLALMPLWLISLYPNALNFIAPHLILRRMTDKMFTGSFLYALSALVTIPILYTLTFILTWMFTAWWIALIYTLLLPAIGLFAWYYRKALLRVVKQIRFARFKKQNDYAAVRSVRDAIYAQLDTILN